MFIRAETAMRKRRMIESPSCAVEVMQQPDLGRLGRFIGPPSVTLGDLGQGIVQVGGLPVTTSPAVSTLGLFGMSWTTIALIGAALLGGVLWYRSRSGGTAGFILPAAKPRRRRTKRIPALTAALYAAGAGAGGYLLGKSLA